MATRDVIKFVRGKFQPSHSLDDPRQARDEGTRRPPFPWWLRELRPHIMETDHKDSLHMEGELDLSGRLGEWQWLRKEVQRWGIDALACYLPFHFYGEKDWGIYIRALGVVYLASVLKGCPRLDPQDQPLLEMSNRILTAHEEFHFRAEIVCSRMEVIAQLRPLYDTYFDDANGSTHEEALANAYIFPTALKGRSVQVRDRMKVWMNGQGPGYRDYDRFVIKRGFEGGCRKASAFMIERGNILPGELLFSKWGRFRVPTHYVMFPSCLPVGIRREFPKDFGMRVSVYSRDERGHTPHIHIEIPPGAYKTRYEWPNLVPLKGEAELSSGERKDLERYMQRHGAAIERKVSRVFIE